VVTVVRGADIRPVNTTGEATVDAADTTIWIANDRLP
jgi:hypothetical protein